MARESFQIGNVRVRPGSKKDVELPITRLVTGGDVSLPVQIVHGKHDGPTIWVSAAIHGEEVMGVEVVRRLLATLKAKDLHGTLVAVPVVNVLGFMAGDRYLPDRRDLNRAFPGSPRGSLASRIAHLFMQEVVGKCELGIDLHTAADRRANLPQLRGDLDDPRTYELAKVFGAPVMLHAKLRDGSLRQAATEAGAMVLLYESGEAMRFDEVSIRTGIAGIRRVMKHLGMITDEDEDLAPLSLEARESNWIRARGTGIFQLECELGDRVEAGRRLGRTSDTFGRGGRVVRADRDGIVIGLTRAPIVNAGDGLVHVAQIVSHDG
jgi:uncharacterized protein